MEPTGVPASIEERTPTIVPKTEIAADEITTLRKLLKISMEEIAGKIISAEIKSEPTRFIARTIITAITTAIITFKSRV